jgi:putative RNA 2'-phosphotransferase
MSNDFEYKHRISRLSKYLALILRHKPEIVDTSLDESGWAKISLEEIAQRIARLDQFTWVTLHDIEEVVRIDPKGRYEITLELPRRIRATYGHSIATKGLLDSPDEAGDLPQIAYYGCSSTDLPTLLRMGITGSDRAFIHLSVNKNDALAIARKKVGRNDRSSIPRIISINVEAACRLNVKFKLLTPLVIISENIPPEFISEIPIPNFFTNNRRGRGQSLPPRESRYQSPSSRSEKRVGKTYKSQNYDHFTKKDNIQKNKSRKIANKGFESITDEDFDFDFDDLEDNDFA